MKTYEIHSQLLACNIQFTYGKSGVLVGFRAMNEEGVDLQKLVNILERSLSEKTMLEVCRRNKIAVQEIFEDLSFERFWNLYGFKDGGSKLKASRIWEKLSNQERSRILTHIPIYKANIGRQNVSQAYATTYLNDRRWEN